MSDTTDLTLNSNVECLIFIDTFRFGFSDKEILGRELHDALAPKRFRPIFQKALGPFQASGNGAAIGNTVELAGLRKDGQEFPMELSLGAFQQDHHWVAIGSVRDITNRKRAEEAAQRTLKSRTALNALLQIGLQRGDFLERMRETLEIILSGSWLVTENRGALFLTDWETGEMRLAVHKGVDEQVLCSCESLRPAECVNENETLDVRI